MVSQDKAQHERRSLKYIRLAAFLASRAQGVDRLEMSIGDIEEVLGEDLPTNARFPSFWRNDERRMHSRAWLTAGWTVDEVRSQDEVVVFSRGARS